ncbi:MAG: geranylgeranyl reductase family protein [Acidimicrobiales bacterium]|nr:geranylgeranyl reductase family protein [Acidimicrobiales bacterium]
MLSCDLVVVGAGPAGTAAAITAARAGREVTLIDKAHFPRDKFCGDGLTAEALRLLDHFGVDPGDLPGWVDVHDVVVRSPKGKLHRFPLPSDQTLHAAVCPRVDLDHALVKRAEAEGAQVLEGRTLTQLTEENDSVVISDQLGDRIRARYLVAADGMWSTTRKLCGVSEPGYLGDWHAFRQYFTGVAPTAQQLVVWFEADLLPGYAWSFPVGGGRANVGFGVHRSSGVPTGRLKQLWPELLERPHIRDWLGPDARPDGPHRAWPIPAQLDGRPLSSGRVLFAGDATAATDPMTGEGIAQALLTGKLAAEALAHGGPNAPELVRQRYEHLVSTELLADHRFARRLSSLLAKPRGVELALNAAGATGWTRRNFARWMFEDYPRAVVLTPRRWHRSMLSPPGAYSAGQ